MILAIINNFSGFFSIHSKPDFVCIHICAQLFVRAGQMISPTNKYVNVAVDTASLNVYELTTFEIKACALFCEKRINKRRL
jgi:hypothetical protein